MTTRHDVVSTELTLLLVISGGAPVPVTTTMRYDPADPYAVRVGFRTGADSVVDWTFARELLEGGLHRLTGEGDVRVWPSADRASQVVHLSLSSPSGHALFEMPLQGIVGFLRRTNDQVPRGCESDHIDLDAELALLVWSDP